jgi:hypothetical protein
MGHSLSNCDSNKNSVEIQVSTMFQNSYNLFDYESKEITSFKRDFNESSMIYRHSKSQKNY